MKPFSLFTAHQPVLSAHQSQSRKKRARFALLIFPLFTLFLMIGSVLLVERLQPDVHDLEYRHRLTILRERLGEEPNQKPFLVMGSSRMALGFAPEHLPKYTTPDGTIAVPFNFAHIGSGPLLNFIVLNRLIRDGIHPGWVILEIMPAFFLREDLGIVSVCSTAEEIAMVDEFTRSHRIVWWSYSKNRFKNYPSLLTQLFEPKKNTTGYHRLGGYGPLMDSITEENRKLRVISQANQYAFRIREFTVQEGEDRVLREFANVCRENGIQVQFLMSPEADGYRRIYGSGVRDKFAEYVFALGQELHVPVVDSRDWLAEEDFFDSHHAMRPGAVKFSQRLGQEVIGPLIAKP